MPAREGFTGVDKAYFIGLCRVSRVHGDHGEDMLRSFPAVFDFVKESAPPPPPPQTHNLKCGLC